MQNCLTRLTVRITTTSGWLQRLVRPFGCEKHKCLSQLVQKYAALSRALKYKAPCTGRAKVALACNRLPPPTGCVSYDEESEITGRWTSKTRKSETKEKKNEQTQHAQP